MRIRKNAKLGGLVLFEELQPLVCQLNQSPWDLIPFDPDLIQFGYGEDNFVGNANVSAGNSTRAIESVSSPINLKLKSLPEIPNAIIYDKEDDVNKQNGFALDRKSIENKMTLCIQCKNNEANQLEQSTCEHNNLSLMRSKKAVTIIGSPCTRARTMKKTSTGTSNPYEFYYYSGFGPLWGKRRGDINGELNNKNEIKVKGIAKANGRNNSTYSSSQIDTEEFDFVDDDDDEEEFEENYEVEGNGESGKKRLRKLVKARSLKSLM